MTGDAEIAALEASLRRRFRVVSTTVVVGDRPISLLHPASAEELINEADFDRDERLPYWAELWPSSRVLGEWVLGLAGAGRTLLDLGCGSGLVSVCAGLAGFHVVASDYYDDAVRFSRVNAWRNGAPIPGGFSLDWRSLPADLPRFDAVVASDVLYELPYGALVAGAIDAAIAPHGVALLADPGRVARDNFIAALPGKCLRVDRRTDVPFVEGVIRQTISVFELARSVPCTRGR